jgi:cobalamin biosynthesis Mg chelatase CobN
MFNPDNEKAQIDSKIEQKVEHSKHCCTCTCSGNTKTKEYVKRAQNKYRQKRLETDPEYAKQMKQKLKQYRENNKDQYNESMRIYMQKYRAKKKAEKHAETTSLQISLENLSIKDEPLATPIVNPALST